MQRLLRILAQSRDRQKTLKPDRVIQELWREKSSTRTAANLATEINRLRRLLDTYYQGPGADDTIRIELPVRSATGGKGAGCAWITAFPASVVEEALQPIAEPLHMQARLPIAERADQPIVQTLPEMAPKPDRWRGRLSWRLLGQMVLGYLLLITLLHGLYFYLTRPMVPQTMQLDGKFLRVLDRDGKEIWHQFFPEGFWAEYYAEHDGQRVQFVDLEGKGKLSVLFAYHPANQPKAHNSTLICYSDRGQEKWRWTPGRDFPALDLSASFYKIMHVDVLAAGSDGHRRIVVSSNHHLDYPHQIAVLSPEGKLEGEYWHAGHLDWVQIADLDGNGQQQILATGVSNGYHQATLVVLDAAHVQGASVEAARPEIQIPGFPPAQERARVLFPRTDLGMLMAPYNVALNPVVVRGDVEVTVHDLDSKSPAEFFYRFDRKLRLTRSDVADGFRKNHDAFYRSNRPRHLWTSEEEKQLHQVVCLAGCASGSDLAAAPAHSLQP